jgi:hypothetical protein
MVFAGCQSSFPQAQLIEPTYTSPDVGPSIAAHDGGALRHYVTPIQPGASEALPSIASVPTD